MEEEIKNFIKVWLTILISMIYTYLISSKIPKGKFRLLSLLPIIALFTYLPLKLTSVHLGGPTAFFIAWNANFKLLLFAFNKGPLSSHPLLPFSHFMAVACFLIKIKPQNPQQNPKNTSRIPNFSLSFAVKFVLFVLLQDIYKYKHEMHPSLVLVLYSSHIYLLTEIILVTVATMVKSILGLELESVFEEPLLSTSLQEFWGKRWNPIVSDIFRPVVFDPIRYSLGPIIGKKWALMWALFGTFVVSGLMHELLFFYLCRVRPTWEVTWLFVFYGVALVVEILGKKVVNGRWRLPPVVSTPLTVGSVMVPGLWLFLSQLLRCEADVRVIREYNALLAFLKSVGANVATKYFL